MHTLADALTAAAWREVIPDPLARAKRLRVRTLLLTEQCGFIVAGLTETSTDEARILLLPLNTDGRAAIGHHIDRLEQEIYGKEKL